MLGGEPCIINGDGESSRDFCYVANAVQANLRAAFIEDPAAMNQVYNVAAGQRTTLTQLHEAIAAGLRRLQPSLNVRKPQFADFRDGDIRHSLADIGKAARLLGYVPSHDVAAGLAETADWYLRQAREQAPPAR